VRRIQAPGWDGARRIGSAALTVLAGLAVWAVLVMPEEMTDMSPSAFLRVPVELLVLVACAVFLPRRWRRVAAVVFGLALGLLLMLKVLNIGYVMVLDRAFDPVIDWAYLGPGVGVIRDTEGETTATLVVVGAVAGALAAVTLLPLAALRLSALAAGHRRPSLVAVTALGMVWILAAVTGLKVLSDSRLASASAVDRVYSDVRQLRADLADRSTFQTLTASDPYAEVADGSLLTALDGKDVLLVFVESYGRTAVQDSSFAPEVVDVLDDGTRTLGRAGWSARSAFLTSPTFGAGSWLAHATMQSGLWVDTQQRYDQLLQQRRLTLTSAFDRAGWHTVFALPNVRNPWPEGEAFYGYAELFDANQIGYRGPTFGWSKMPDQFTLKALHEQVLADQDRPPVMAEVDLASSHHPWTPLPELLPWDDLGDGSVYRGTRTQSASEEELFSDPDAVRAAYGDSIVYSWRTLVSWMQRYADPDLVMVVLGDHQPHSYVSGDDADHDVPVTVLAQDPAVMSRISTWGWQEGLRPLPDAPVWRMDSFRDRFLSAFSGPG
jgi:hypothetical protein